MVNCKNKRATYFFFINNDFFSEVEDSEVLELGCWGSLGMAERIEDLLVAGGGGGGCGGSVRVELEANTRLEFGGSEKSGSVTWRMQCIRSFRRFSTGALSLLKPT